MTKLSQLVYDLERNGEKMTREDTITWMMSMLPENCSFLEQGGASYGKDIRELEAVLRPLWGLLPLICTEEKKEEESPAYKKAMGWFSYFHAIVSGQKLPQITRASRQIVVETGVLSYGLGIFKEKFLRLFTDDERKYLLDWLSAVNETELPENNWLFFRVLLNTALKVNGLAWSTEKREADLKKIHSWYLGNGWYSDGNTKQKDYYIAFGFHYYGMLYARMERDEHAELFLERARLFAGDFIWWFDSDGRSLPFGRSLTYRFAHVCFWSNFLVSGAYKDTCMPSDSNKETHFTIEICKGIIARNLEFWKKQPIRQPGQGNLTIGYGYSNLLLSEDYNAPGSPSWSFKTFGFLEFPAEHPFWNVEEKAYPKTEGRIEQPFAGLSGIVREGGRHHVVLSADQCSVNPYLYHRQEKYGKFAYSTYFGFNLTRDVRYIRQFAVDNGLALSLRGCEQYTAREKITASRMYERYSVSWWETDFARVCTYLLPLDNDIHVRIHELQCSQKLDSYEGGFPLFDWNPKFQREWLSQNGAELENTNGLSRITDLLENREPKVIPQGPNTNIYSCEPNGVPALYGALDEGLNILACAVIAVPGSRSKEKPKDSEHTKVCLEAAHNGWKVFYGKEEIFVVREKEW